MDLLCFTHNNRAVASPTGGVCIYVCIYVCMHVYILFSHFYQTRRELLVKVFKPVRVQLNWETEFPSPRLRSKFLARDTGSAVPSRVSPLILHAQTVP